jgi:uncharacterized protein YjbI with pentapeptide repeats
LKRLEVLGVLLNVRYWLRENLGDVFTVGAIGLFLGLFIILVLVCLGYLFAWWWVGVFQYEYGTRGEPVAVVGRVTLWDWIKVCVVPIAVAVAAALFAWHRSVVEHELASDRQEQDYLERYFTRMEELLFQEGLRQSIPFSEVRIAARARTLDVLRRLNGARQGQVLQFLHDGKLIKRPDSLFDSATKSFDYSHPIVSLEDADMTGIDLYSASLREAFLYRVRLSFADLRYAHMDGTFCFSAEFRQADLRYANAGLIGRILSEGQTIEFHSDFTGADLRKAKLQYCNLRGADLSAAHLQGAETDDANLEGVVLTRETHISIDQLARAYSYEYAFCWNDGVKNDIFSQIHAGTFTADLYPKPLDGGNWSLGRRLGSYAHPTDSD